MNVSQPGPRSDQIRLALGFVRPKTYAQYSPVSLSPADGWRAIYLHEPDEGEPGWSAEPLIGWGVFDVTHHPVRGESGLPTEPVREIHGVAMQDTAFCVADVANFWRYAAPGDSDPTDEEVAAERARRGPR